MAKSSPVSAEGGGAGSPAGGSCGSELHLNSGVADATGAHETLDAQNALALVNLEARLTDEVRRLVVALNQFGGRAQSIGIEVPDNAHFTKLVSSTLVLIGFQLAYALGKGLDKPIFFDDGAEYLRELNLCLSDFVREVNLDGRRFLAVALIDKQSCELSGTRDGADQC